MVLSGPAYCRQCGNRVPDDLSIVGWGMEAAVGLPRRLTTTVTPTTLIGKAAAKGLVARLKGEPGPDVPVVPARLLRGETA